MPTYHDLGDHTETLQLDYDPRQVSYDSLLDLFWESHRPVRRPWSRQYMSAVFYHNDQQKRLAVVSKTRQETILGRTIYTEILPVGIFYLAEGYHQKYYLRMRSDFMAEVYSLHPVGEAWVDSTVAARLNGYLGGYGSLETLQAELEGYGLSPAGREKLLAIGLRLKLPDGKVTSPVCECG